MSKINKIKLSGTTYDVEDANASKTVELTQAQYDALVSSGAVDSNTFYIITDASVFDPSLKVDTSAITSSVTSASTDSEIPTAKAVFDAMPTGGTGGGKAIEAGIGISVTTGETADTISLNEAISASTASSSTSIAIGSGAKAQAGYNEFLSNSGGIAIGSGATAQRRDICIGNGAKGYNNIHSGLISIGLSSVSKQGGIAIGNYSEAYGENGYDNYGGISIGFNSNTQSRNAIAIGYNTFATGTTKININNQLKIDDSNQVYIYNKDNTEMICLQDSLGGGGGGGITSGEVQTMIDESISGKADSTDVYTKSETSGATEISNALAEKLDSSAYTPSIAYSAGSGINIDSANTISVSDVSHSGLTDGTLILLRNSDYTTVSNYGYENIRFDYYYGATNNKSSLNFKPITINGYRAVRTNDVSLNLVETSAITTSISSSSTDAQVPSAKCVYDTLGGLKLVKLTQTEYDNLSPNYDSNTLYVIVN